MHDNFSGREKLPGLFKVTIKVVGPVMKWWGVSLEECGERVVYLATGRFPARGTEGDGKGEVAVASDGVVGGGAYRVDLDNEIDSCPKNYRQLREDGMEEKVWKHTIEAFEEIEAGKRFTG